MIVKIYIFRFVALLRPSGSFQNSGPVKNPSDLISKVCMKLTTTLDHSSPSPRPHQNGKTVYSSFFRNDSHILTVFSKINDTAIEGHQSKKGKQFNHSVTKPITATSTVKPDPDTSPKSKAKTTFLTLPRELRQEILYLSFNIGISVGNLSMFHPRFRKLASTVNNSRRDAEKSRTTAWKVLLGEIHEIVKDDMTFVYGKWEGEIEKVLKVCNEEDKFMSISSELIGMCADKILSEVWE